MAKIISDSLSMSDIMPITPREEKICKRNHIPVLHGKLFEKDEFGNLIFKHSNTVVLGGSINALEKLTGVFASYRPQSRNMAMMNKLCFTRPADTNGVNYDDAYEKSIDSTSRICLFGVGHGGAGDTFDQVYAPDFKQTSISDWLPFRISANPTLNVAGLLYGTDNAAERAKYHFMILDTSQPIYKYQWYLKEFESDPEVKSMWKNAPDLTKDGTEIVSDSDVSSGPSGVGIESFAEFVIHIDPEDIRPFFENNGALSKARYNSIGLFTASLMTPNYTSGVNLASGDSTGHLSADNYREAFNTRLFSVVNFENDSLKQKKEITYVYRIYSSL